MEKVESESPRLSQMWRRYLPARDSELCRLAVIKADSTVLLRHGEKVETVLDLVRTRKEDFTLEEMVKEGFAGVCCVKPVVLRQDLAVLEEESLRH